MDDQAVLAGSEAELQIFINRTNNTVMEQVKNIGSIELLIDRSRITNLGILEVGIQKMGKK